MLYFKKKKPKEEDTAVGQTASFRAAGFGGFHRQDVLDYIERIAREHKEQVEALTRSLEEARQQAGQNASLQAELEAANARAQALEQERDELRQQLEQLLSEGQTVQELKQQLDESRTQAEGYQRLKCDYAEIELDARRRAASILEQANDRVRQQQAESQIRQEQLIAQAESRAESILEQARQQAELTLAHAQDEALHLQEERRQLLFRTRKDFETSSADLKSSVSGALREVEQVRQLLLDLSTTFEENVHAVDELCGEEV